MHLKILTSIKLSYIVGVIDQTTSGEVHVYVPSPLDKYDLNILRLSEARTLTRSVNRDVRLELRSCWDYV